MKRAIFVGLMAALAGAGSDFASAAPFTVVNSSFEADAEFTNVTGSPTGWTVFDDLSPKRNDFRGVHAEPSGTSNLTPRPDGSTKNFLSNGLDLYQVLTTTTLQANTQYKVLVDIGHRGDSPAWNTNFPGIGVRLGAGNTPGVNLLTLVDSFTPVPNNASGHAWETWELTFATGPSPAGLGSPLRIELHSSGTLDNTLHVQAQFDNVRVLQVVPESTSVTMWSLAGIAVPPMYLAYRKKWKRPAKAR